jgi:hypothetical protein
MFLYSSSTETYTLLVCALKSPGSSLSTAMCGMDLNDFPSSFKFLTGLLTRCHIAAMILEMYS